jgi:hypothetical protein
LASAVPPLAFIVFSGSGFGLSPLEAIAAGTLALGGWAGGLMVTRHPLLDEIIKTFPALRRARASAG